MLLAIELVIAILMPIVGIPLILATLAVMLLTGALKGVLGLARGPANARTPTFRYCAECGLELAGRAEPVWVGGAPFHQECWRPPSP